MITNIAMNHLKVKSYLKRNKITKKFKKKTLKYKNSKKKKIRQ